MGMIKKSHKAVLRALCATLSHQTPMGRTTIVRADRTVLVCNQCGAELEKA